MINKKLLELRDEYIENFKKITSEENIKNLYYEAKNYDSFFSKDPYNVCSKRFQDYFYTGILLGKSSISDTFKYNLAFRNRIFVNILHRRIAAYIYIVINREKLIKLIKMRAISNADKIITEKCDFKWEI